MMIGGAVEALNRGMHLRRIAWPHERRYIALGKSGKVILECGDRTGTKPYNASHDDLLANDWQTVEASLFGHM